VVARLEERGSKRRILNHGFNRFTAIRGESCKVNEPCHFRIMARFGDYCASVGMADEDRRTVLRTIALRRLPFALDEPAGAQNFL